jgi:hypothetical protein
MTLACEVIKKDCEELKCMGPHKLLDDPLDRILSLKCVMILQFVSSTSQWAYIWKDLNAAKVNSLEKYTPLFDKMAALTTECSWYVFKFARSRSIVAVQQAFRRQICKSSSSVVNLKAVWTISRQRLHLSSRTWRVQQFFYCCMHYLSQERVYWVVRNEERNDNIYRAVA